MVQSEQRAGSTVKEAAAGTVDSEAVWPDHPLDAEETSRLRPDGTVFPPVTPDPPAPPGYVSPVDASPILDSPILQKP